VRDAERLRAKDKEHFPQTQMKQVSTIRRWLVMVFATLPLAGVVGVIVYGYLAKPGWVGVAGKTFWDFLELLIVPAALAIGVYWLNRAQRKRELQIENQRAQDEALQAYIDSMEKLLLDKELRSSKEDSEVRLLARARTLTVLPGLDSHRKGSVLQFLYELGLLSSAKGEAIVRLNGADFEGLVPQGISMLGPWERRGVGTSQKVHLDKGANLIGATLEEANLRKANLENARLNDANLAFADLSEANLTGASLRGAHLIVLYFEGAIVKDTIMPDGQILRGDKTPNGPTLEDWLKDNTGSREYRENA